MTIEAAVTAKLENSKREKKPRWFALLCTTYFV